MKNIRSFLLIATGIFASTLIHAQDLKPEVSKPMENTVPAPGSKPAVAADSKPTQQLTYGKVETVPVPATSSAREETAVAKPLSTEQLKTLNGTAERPKQPAPVAADKNEKPVLVIIPAKLNGQQ